MANPLFRLHKIILFNALITYFNNLKYVYMIWFCIHNILKCSRIELDNQTRNLTTFLSGIVLYVLFYSYVGSLDLERNVFVKRLFGFFVYILLADAISMSILYKNFYKETIFREIKETIGTKTMPTDLTDLTETIETPPETPKTPKTPKTNETNKINKINKINEIFMLEEFSDTTQDSYEGFVKNSSLGDAFTTNGTSNNE